MAQPVLDDALWSLIEPQLPPSVARPKGGRPPLDNRKVLTGLIFVLKTGIPWEYLPQELGCGSGMTCWRRLRAWQQAGIWKSVHHILLNQLRAADRIDWSRAVIDSASVRAVGGAHTGPNPTDRGKPGSKHHVITDAQGVPLAASVTGAHRHDVPQLLPLVDRIPAVAGRVGRPRRRPDQVQGDRAYDSQAHRRALRQRGIGALLARRGQAHGSGLGVYRWVVERTLAWLHQFRRLRVHWERRAEVHEALLDIGCILICGNYLKEFC